MAGSILIRRVLLAWTLYASAAQGAELAKGFTPSQAPTKGHMQGIVGDVWTLRVDTTAAEKVDFLPDGEPLSPEREQELRDETLASFRYLKDYARYRGSMLASGYYTSGKGFQKVGMVCLLLERFLNADDMRTQECAEWLTSGFRCFYDPTAENCWGASASYYDSDWGGLVSKQGWDSKECNSDYGNTCYNDHHYHFGYFVVSAAILAKLKPSMLQDAAFVGYVNTLVRDTSNPSTEDQYFPQFRTFDWFDLHSWSHGVQPMHDGKDQESTSEELNLLYGLHLWGRVTRNDALQQLGATMLSFAAHTVREFFLMKDGNPYHDADFVKNHVTGIFLQNKVDYTTWFGRAPEHIHGIQMLPLSPALQLTRRPDFCYQEWRDVLEGADLSRMTKAWASIILSGGLAMIDPLKAYHHLRNIDEGQMDNGLSRAWALYWTAIKPGTGALGFAEAKAGRMTAEDDTSGVSLLVPIGAKLAPSITTLPSAKGIVGSVSSPTALATGRCLQPCFGLTFSGGPHTNEHVCTDKLCADSAPFVSLDSFGCNTDSNFATECCDIRLCSQSMPLLDSTFAPTVVLSLAPTPSATPAPSSGELPVTAPDGAIFPTRSGHPVPPAHTEVIGPKATNKFWTNWVVGNGEQYPIYVMPYVLKWGGPLDSAPVLEVAHGGPRSLGRHSSGRMKGYITNSITEFTMGAKEAANGYYVVSEGITGFNAEIRGRVGEKIMFPIYSGMAYISGRYSGGFTPKVTHPHGIAGIRKVQDGIWSFHNRRGREFRVYAFHSNGTYVDSSYYFDVLGTMNQALDGWVRLAHVIAPGDVDVLDAHARAVLVGVDLEVQNGGVVRYNFQKDRADNVEVLHFAYGHHVQLMQQDLQSSMDGEAADKSMLRDGPLLL